MSIAEILKLIEAGFTHDEIMKLTQNNDAEKIEHPPTKVENEAEKKTDVKEEKEPEPKPEPNPEPPQESETEKLVKALGLKFDSLTAAIQKSNVNNIEQGALIPTTDEILASIINPKNGGK